MRKTRKLNIFIPFETEILYLFNFDSKNSAENLVNGSEAILLRIWSTINAGYRDDQLFIPS